MSERRKEQNTPGKQGLAAVVVFSTQNCSLPELCLGPVCFFSLVACSEAKAAALWTVLSFNDKSNMMKVWREAINSALGGKVKATGRTPGVGKVGALGGTAILQCVPEPPPTAAWRCVSSEQVTVPSFHSKLQRLAWGQVPSPPPPPPHAHGHTLDDAWCSDPA